ncbi:MAG: NAD-dependent epimerase/dehydratase family protein [bacterium]|nr:NAD-dependent epimerase/dehydratase family protein [bacterium]
MDKRILAIGGSYFVGRVFSILASRDGNIDLHVVNRGRQPLNKENITEHKCDRHDIAKFAQTVEGLEFDALVDFCAYMPGEVAPIIEAIKGQIKQYILVSTASVYVPNDELRVEGDEILYESTNDQVAQYICSKSKLEKECIEACEAAGIAYTIIRPSFVYGPFNYAPRESWYVQKIAKGEKVPNVVGTTSKFTFTYVVDLADALLKCAKDERAYNEIFNVSAPEQVTYESYMDVLKKLSPAPFETYDVTMDDVLRQGIAVPFPLDENQIYDGSKFANAFGFKYTSFEEGMGKAIQSCWNVYGPRG